MAKSALRRKKAHEHSLEQTQAQIGTLEQQINAIESANINRETLAAMERAGEAMKQIHGKLTPEKVDETMCVAVPRHSATALAAADARATTGTSSGSRTRSARRSSNAIVQNSVGEAVDDADLEEELEAMQQEQLDEHLLETGTVPVSDAVERMPALNGEGEWATVLPARDSPSLPGGGAAKGKAPAIEEDDEEAELRKLQAEMAM